MGIARKINRSREDRWDDEEKREHILQREALRELRMNQHKKDNQKEKTLEGRRSDESMKAFKERIKQETRKASFQMYFISDDYTSNFVLTSA